MGMKALDELRDKFCEELEEISRKGELGAGDLDIVHKLTDTIKNIDKICIMEEEGGYSQAGDWEARGRYMTDYDDGNSYRGRNRDSMGRYTRENRGGNYSQRGRRGYSRDGGKESMMEHVDMMMDMAGSDNEREMIRRFKKQLQEI